MNFLNIQFFLSPVSCERCAVRQAAKDSESEVVTEMVQELDLNNSVSSQESAGSVIGMSVSESVLSVSVFSLMLLVSFSQCLYKMAFFRPSQPGHIRAKLYSREFFFSSVLYVCHMWQSICIPVAKFVSMCVYVCVWVCLCV